MVEESGKHEGGGEEGEEEKRLRVIHDQWCFSNYIQIKDERGARRAADGPSTSTVRQKEKNNPRGNSGECIFTCV